MIRRRTLPILLPLLLLGWLIPLLAPPAAAQPATLSPDAAATADSLAVLACEDTLLALGRLFVGQRRGNRLSGMLYSLSAGITGYTVATGSPKTIYQQVSTGLIAGVGIYSVYRAGGHLLRLRRYRAGREKRVLAVYEQGQPLPARLRRQLTPAYFNTRITTSQ